MKLVHILPGLTRGGAEELLVQIIQQLPHHEHHIFYVYDGPLKQRLLDSGAHLHHIQGIFFSYDLFYFYHLIKKMHILSPDCIHALLWSASIVARIMGKLLRIPVVCGIHARHSYEGKFRVLAQRLVPIMPQKFIAASKGIAEDLIIYHNVDPSLITTIENGISIPADCDKKNTSRISILAVGRFVPFKNFVLLINLFCKLVTYRPNIHLTLVGWGPQENELKLLVKNLTLEQHITFVINQPAQPYFETADIFIQPSINEGLSIALLEAFAYECAVVVNSTNHTHDVIDHMATGIIVNCWQTDVFVQQLITIIDDENLRTKLQKSGKQLVCTKYSINNVAQRYDQIFNNAI